MDFSYFAQKLAPNIILFYSPAMTYFTALALLLPLAALLLSRQPMVARVKLDSDSQLNQ
ncbi:MAG: hypothetical protein WAU37_02780 [Formosimonas sp.]